MAAPTFFGKGTLNPENSGTSITPIAFPASIAANDIAVLAAGCGGATGVDFTTPTSQGSWAVLGTSLNSAGQSTAWYWLRLAGTEGSESVDANTTFGNTNGGYGQLFVFRGCITTGNPFEGVGNEGTGAQTTPDTTACTTTGPDRLVVSITQLDDDPAFASGYPPSGWTDRGTDSSTTGSDWRNYIMDRTEASATTVASAVVGTLGASIRYRTITFALIPAADEQTGTVAETQDNQTSTASGVIEITGTVAETQDAQTSTASGVLGYTGTSARTQDNQTSSASGTVSGSGVSGSVAETQDAQTSTASGVLGYTGTVARTQANQTSTASGQSAITGTSARTQANQIAAGSGWILITGTSARTQADQTASASGTVGSPPITGTVARTQADQTATAAGWIQITGLVAETQDSQTAVAAGTVSGVLSTKHLLPWTSDSHLQAATSDPHLVATTSDSHLLVAED